ncbi:unnamed protein product [Prunus brigantina]
MGFAQAKGVVLVQLSLFLLSCFIVLGKEIESLAPNSHAPVHPPSHAPAHSPSHHHHHHHHHHGHPPSHAPVHPHSHSPVHPPSHSPVHPPSHSPVHPPSHSPVHPPSQAPAQPPTHHHHHHGHPPSHAPVHPPSQSPVHPPSHSPAHSPSHHHHSHPPSHAPVHPPSHAPVQPPSHPPTHHSPSPSPSHPPVHPPQSPPKSFVAVQGVVYCKSCKYSKVDTLLGASPLQGATVKLQCNDTKKPLVVKANTDKKGYFFITAPKHITSHGAHKCKVSLVSSPSASCSKPSDFQGGLRGAILKPEKPFVSGKLPFFLYSVGPFAFEPKCHH